MTLGIGVDVSVATGSALGASGAGDAGAAVSALATAGVVFAAGFGAVIVFGADVIFAAFALRALVLRAVDEGFDVVPVAMFLVFPE